MVLLNWDFEMFFNELKTLYPVGLDQEEIEEEIPTQEKLVEMFSDDVCRAYDEREKTQGLGPSAGTYVRYNHEALIGILALEAYRAQALVVGEDLGTVEPWVREYLSRCGLTRGRGTAPCTST